MRVIMCLCNNGKIKGKIHGIIEGRIQGIIDRFVNIWAHVCICAITEELKE